MPVPRFHRRIIGELNNEADCTMNTLFTVGDLNSDGYPDIVTAGRSGQMAWFENPGVTGGAWERHLVARVENIECGGLVYDLNGDGLPDIVDGGDYRSNELNWWQNPGRTGEPWRKRTIAVASGTQFHDELIGDLKDDGGLSLVFWNEGSQTLCCAPVPADPTASPWPDIEVIATNRQVAGQPEEGLAIADLDGDGRNELVAGTHWYEYRNGRWEGHQFAGDYITTVIAVGDIDSDGRPEVVLAEGDACIYGRTQGGKLAWFKAGADIRSPWEEHLIMDGLLDPHSVQLGKLCGNGRLDLVVGEIGVRERYEENPPRLFLFENKGNGEFQPHLIDSGIGVHHARLLDTRKNGRLDIVSRPLHGDLRWKIFLWENQGFG